MDEAKAEAEANSREAEAKIALIFSTKFYILTPFSPKPRNCGSIFDGTSKIRLKTGFNTETVLVNTPKTTIYAFGRRLLLRCLHTE